MSIHKLLLAGVLILPSIAFGTTGGTQMLTESQAMQLAENYVVQHYGAQTAQAQKPYRAEKDGERWIISGKPPKALGGSFRAVIGANGELEEITHGK